MVIQEAVYEVAIYGSVLDKSDSEKMKEKMQSKYKNTIENRLISMKESNMSVKVEGNSVTVSISAEMKMVGIGFLPNYNANIISAEKSVTSVNPIPKIRILKMIKDMK